MRLRPGFLLALVTGSLLGCATGEPVRPTSWLDRFRPFQGAAGKDVVQMDVAIVETPVEDRYLDRDLWTSADEHVVPLDRKGLLEDNGFRIGLVGGLPPPGLQNLLTSARSCINPQHLEVRSGASRAVPVGKLLPACRFELRLGEQHTPVSLERAQCMFQLVPSLTKDGRVQLHVVPQIQHGERVLIPRPAADRSGWEQQQPHEDYAALGWDVVLGDNDFVVIGSRYECRGTLGYESFVRMDEARPVQRVLVIRAGRKNATFDSIAPGAEEISSSRSPPLALQATWSCVRGTGR
jgi:hypothetical protein